MEIQKEILKACMAKGFLLDREMLSLLSGLEENAARELIESIGNLKIGERVITKSLFSKNFEKIRNVLVNGKHKTIIEKFFINLGYVRAEVEISKENDSLEDVEKTNENYVKVLSSPVILPKKVEVIDFVKHFRARYGMIKQFLEEKNLDNLTAIRRIGSSKESFTIIASVLEKRITKSKNILLKVEDVSGAISVLVNHNKKEAFDKAKDLLEDDIVAFEVSGSNEILFCNNIIFPEASLPQKRKSETEEIACFISDIHIGSTMFLEDNFLKFIKWINGEEGDFKQRELAKKVKYLFINGDVVDGVGHFPGQDKWLNIQDIKGQYKKFYEFLKLVRKDINIILAPGNHDAVWVGEPQPIISEEWAEGLYKLDNLTLVTNPCLVEITGGFKILMYHGASMHSMINNIEYLRVNFGTDSPAKVGKEILKRRHLAPTHGNVDYIPSEKEDSLVIKYVPDILTTADLHRSEVATHNNVLIIATSCWQSMTPFQEKVGNHPDFCKVPLFNLKTREIKVLDFYDEEVEEKNCEEGKEGEEVVCEVKK